LAGSLRGFPAGFTFYICRYAVNGAECGLVVSFWPARDARGSVDVPRRPEAFVRPTG